MLDYNFPDLKEPYASALREAVGYAAGRFAPVIGVIAAGSILRGQGDARSDIDLYVIFAGEYRQRVQKWFAGVPVEIFANPPRRMPQYFEEELRDGSPSTAHMMVTGHVVYEASPVVEQLREQARQYLALSPQYSPESLTFRRYFIVDQIENAFDLRERDPEMGAMLLGAVLFDLVRYYFALAGRYEPRHKDLLRVLRAENRVLAQQFDAFQHATLHQRFQIVGQLADQILGTRGFFEWESAPQSVE